MKLGFLIITFGTNYLDITIPSIQKYYPDIPIYIVNNNTEIKLNLPNFKYIYISDNIGNFYELGAIWHAVKTWPDVEKFIIFHNTFKLLDKFPDTLLKLDFSPFWSTISADYSPTIPFVEDKLKERGFILEHDRLWNSITGCCCIVSTVYLKKLISMGFDTIYATNKAEAVGCEILFGYLFNNILKIWHPPLFKFTIVDYYEKKEPWIYIEKLGSNQGATSSGNNYFMQNIFEDKLLNRLPLNNPNLAFVLLMKNINEREYTHDFIRNTFPGTLFCSDIPFINTSINIIRHRLFTKKYFPSYYDNEFLKITNFEKTFF